MRLLRSRFLQAVLVLVLAFVILRFGIRLTSKEYVDLVAFLLTLK